MVIITATDIVYEIQGRELLQVEQLQMNKGDVIGVVGRNGSGKTSLVNILAGKIKPAKGEVVTASSVRLVPQLKRNSSFKSGGELTQEYLNAAYVHRPELLLLDEPTTNLDTEHIERLEKDLRRWIESIVIVSHDRDFLDALCNKIWEVENGTVVEYKGNYSNYEEARALKIRQQESDYDHYVKKKKELERAIELKKKKAARATKNPNKKTDSDAKQMGTKPYFAKKQKKLDATANAIKTRMEQLHKVDKVVEVPPLKMNIVKADELGNRVIIRVNELTGKIKERLLWKPTTFHIRTGTKLAILGGNGTGKTTFIKKLCARVEGINVSNAVKIGYFSQNIDVLDETKTIIENVQQTSSQAEALIRTVLARLQFFGEDVYKPVQLLSGGERVKTAFAKIFLSDINTLVLDEPSNFLDVFAIKELESLLKEYQGTVIFASHDRRFIHHIATQLLIIKNEEMELFDGNFSMYQQQMTSKKTSNHSERLLILETEITEIISRLSIQPDSKLEERLQQLLWEKKGLQKDK